jgi:cellulose synthase/poly-beta-1,6-N-acetylglucosamine synthase-like glycosyltransferase
LEALKYQLLKFKRIQNEIKNNDSKAHLILNERTEQYIKNLIIFIISASLLFGVANKSNTLTLLFIFFTSIYQVARLYIYFFGTLKWEQKVKFIKEDYKNISEKEYPLISIIVPCFNEETVITNSLKSLVQIDYPSYEIIVIDDGSTDRTSEFVQKYIDQNESEPIQLITKENGGKAESLNFGIAKAHGEFLLFVDADSQIDKNSLKEGIIYHLNDSSIAAVAGAVKVRNTNSLITMYQELEYGVGDIQKAFMSNFGKVNIVPGPIGLFRRDALLEVGGYELIDKTFAEDTELTLRLIKKGWKIVFEPKMVSHTEAPNKWSCLFRQRYRWTRGIHQALRKNIGQLMASDKKLSAYLLIEKLCIPTLDLSILMFFIGQFIQSAQVGLFVSYSLIIILTEVIIVSYLRWYSKRSIVKNIPSIFFSRFYFSIVLSGWKIFSLFEEWENQRMTWDKLTRIGISNQKELS